MKIAVLGAGSWGTALGQVLSENGHDPLLWHLEYDFVEEIRFDRLGTFTYSEEEGTLAARLSDNISRDVKNERLNKLQELQYEIILEKNESLIGKTLKVLVDKSVKKVGVGRTEYDSPEIDNIVHIRGNAKKGQFCNVLIDSVNEYELIGSVI